MPTGLTERELQDFFEEVWQLTKMAADGSDWHLVPRLIETTREIAEWRDMLYGRRSVPDRTQQPPQLGIVREI